MVEANTDVLRMTGLRPGDANISYNVYPVARGKGYASRAVALMERFLIGKGARRAVLRIDPSNESSLSIPARLGYRELDSFKTSECAVLRMFVKYL